jgi:hypothetical protein
MKHKYLIPLFLILGACSNEQDNVSVDVQQVDALPDIEESEIISKKEQPLELEWDDLIPDDWRPDKFLAQYNLDEITDEDPRAREIEQRLKEMYDKAPTVAELDGTLVKIPGYFIPVEMDGKKVTTFLLVPYMGACIHTPPPPANQTLYVKLPEGLGVEYETFEAVWVVGIIKIQQSTQSLALDNANSDSISSGYVIEATEVSIYEY